MDGDEEKIRDNPEYMNDWWKIIVAAIVGAVVGSLFSFGATYYTHGREIEKTGGRINTLDERLKTAEGKLDKIADKLNVILSLPSPSPTTSPAVSPIPDSVKIEIGNPANNTSVDVQRSEKPGDLACFYYVRGTSVNVESSDKLNWYVLVRPQGDKTWYIQNDDSEINPVSGDWSIKAWIGDTKTAPKPGEIFEVAAVVTEPSRVEGKTQVGNLNELQPKAKSIITGLKVGNIK